MTKRFEGIIPPVVTLFDQNGEIDWEANKKLVDWLIDQGVHGILLMGSCGEFSALALHERKQFSEEIIRYIDGRIPVLVGAGGTSFKDTMDLSQHAKSAGADGILLVNPYYWNYTQDQLYQYYSVIADRVNIPIMLYNIPLLTGQSLSSELVCRLAGDHSNVVGIKETVESLGDINEMLLSAKKVRPDFQVFSAYDEHLLPGLQAGTAGSINGGAVFAPQISVQLYQSYRDKDFAKAIQLQQKLVNLTPIYQYGTHLFMGMKEAVHQCILHFETGARFPCVPNDKKVKDKVRALLMENGLLS